MEIRILAVWFAALCSVIDGDGYRHFGRTSLLVFKANSVAHATDLFTFEGGKDAFSFGQ
jgi:hypothetical protein